MDRQVTYRVSVSNLLHGDETIDNPARRPTDENALDPLLDEVLDRMRLKMVNNFN